MISRTPAAAPIALALTGPLPTPIATASVGVSQLVSLRDAHVRMLTALLRKPDCEYVVEAGRARGACPVPRAIARAWDGSGRLVASDRDADEGRRLDQVVELLEEIRSDFPDPVHAGPARGVDELLLRQLARDRYRAELHRGTGAYGGELVRLWVEENLAWVLAAPGTPLDPMYAAGDVWSWRVQRFGTERSSVVALERLIELVPPAGVALVSAHAAAIGEIEARQANEDGLGPVLEALRAERAGAEHALQRHAQLSRGGPLRVVSVHWTSEHLVAGDEPHVGEEHERRLEALLYAGGDDERAVARIEVDLKCSVISLHAREGLIEFGGELTDEVTLPVVGGERIHGVALAGELVSTALKNLIRVG